MKSQEKALKITNLSFRSGVEMLKTAWVRDNFYNQFSALYSVLKNLVLWIRSAFFCSARVLY
jgi:hypothetical protein